MRSRSSGTRNGPLHPLREDEVFRIFRKIREAAEGDPLPPISVQDVRGALKQMKASTGMGGGRSDTDRYRAAPRRSVGGARLALYGVRALFVLASAVAAHLGEDAPQENPRR